MSWSTPRTYTNGELVTDVMLNATRDQLLQTAPAKVTTAGDLVYATGANALAPLPAVATGSVLKSAGVGAAPAYAPLALGDLPAALVNALMPWMIDIDVPSVRPVTDSGFLAYAPSPPQDTYFGLSYTGQNAFVEYAVVLAAGTWSINVMAYQAGNRGIATVALDGASVGTIDMYTAVQDAGHRFSLTGVAVAATGKKLLRLTMATKNASSAGYELLLQRINLRRTA